MLQDTDKPKSNAKQNSVPPSQSKCFVYLASFSLLSGGRVEQHCLVKMWFLETSQAWVGRANLQANVSSKDSKSPLGRAVLLPRRCARSLQWPWRSVLLLFPPLAAVYTKEPAQATYCVPSQKGGGREKGVRFCSSVSAVTVNILGWKRWEAENS